MFDVAQNTDISHEVAIFEKEGHYSVVAFTRTRDGWGLIGRNDSRLRGVTRSPQQSHEIGQRNFEGSVKHSIDNGWRLLWRGFPHGRKDY